MNRAANSPQPTPWQREWRALHCAITFLTRIPLSPCPWEQESLGRAALYFPVVGLLVGTGGAGVYLLALTLWSAPVAIALALATMLLITGGFHEDGLADTADGFGGGWTVEDKLRIMKDSRIGSYGSLALIMALLLKFAALDSLPPAAIASSLVLGQVLSRWAALPLIRYTSYVRGDGGTGKPLVGGVTGRRLATASVFSLILLVLLRPDAFLTTVISLVLVTLLWRWHCQRQIGGITGDALGTGNQLAELTVYLVLASLANP